MSHNMRVVNTYVENAERHKIAYKYGTAESQIDYILCRSSDKGNIKDGKVILGESVSNQHRPLVCTLISNKATVRKSTIVPTTKEEMVEISGTRPWGSVYSIRREK